MLNKPKSTNYSPSPLLNSTRIFVMFILLLAPCIATAKAKLWLYPDPGGPGAGGHIVEGSEFTLVIENLGTGKGDNIATEIQLLIAANDPSLIATVTCGSVGTLSSGDFSYGLPFFVCSSKGIPPHGAYPADFASLSLGDLGPGETIVIEISVASEEGLELHFDAIAIGYETKTSGTKCYDVINPSGHCVTLINGESTSGDCVEASIEKTGSSSGVLIDETLDYTITIENTGTCDLTNVVITDQIPTVEDPSSGVMLPAFTVTSTDPAPTTQTEQLITWELEDVLPPDESVTVSLTVSFDQPLADTLEITNIACFDAEELEEPLCDEFTVAVGETSEGDHLGGPGFWCNRIRAALEGSPSATFTIEELELMLVDIDEYSTVFSELEDVSTLEIVQALLCQPSLAEGALDKLLRHLLTLWFNVINNELLQDMVISELCSGEGELPEDVDPEMTVGALIEAAEADLLAEVDDAILLMWKDAIDYINNARLPGTSGCDPSDNPTRSRSKGEESHRRTGPR